MHDVYEINHVNRGNEIDQAISEKILTLHPYCFLNGFSAFRCTILKVKTISHIPFSSTTTGETFGLSNSKSVYFENKKEIFEGFSRHLENFV